MIALISILVIVIDQLSKFLLSDILPLNKTIPVIKNIFHLTLIHNTGIAFGVFKGGSRIILLFTVIGLILIIHYLRKDFLSYKDSLNKKALFINKLAIGFILGGAIGNLIDRVRFGYVIDFLDFRVWPVFNLADSCITIGALILFWTLFIPVKTKLSKNDQT